jgi:hypothetical protein
LRTDVMTGDKVTGSFLLFCLRTDLNDERWRPCFQLACALARVLA